jgi:chemotaxis protein MotA
MDKATLLGLLLGLTAVLGGHVLEGGSLSLIFQTTAAVIVLGGTAAAVSLSFPPSALLAALRALPRVVRQPRDDSQGHLLRLVEMAYRARRDGLLALEKTLAQEPDPFCRRGVELLVGGFSAAEVREILQGELAQEHDTALTPARVFEAAGGYAPTLGILGAVLGLIQVMQHLTEPAKLGTGVAVAFVATIYGVAGANLLFLPLAHKLRLQAAQERRRREMILEGLVALGQGEHPRLIAERLQSYLPEEVRRSLPDLISTKVFRLTPKAKRSMPKNAGPKNHLSRG